MEARRARDSDRRVTVNNIQVMLVCGLPGDRGGGTETPAASVPRHKVQALFTLVGLAHGVVTEKLRFPSVKFPAGPGEAKENHTHLSLSASGGWGYPRPPLTEIEDRRA
jgi:hypothetical protein